jgi:transcription elongation GreA/GreB family factor
MSKSEGNIQNVPKANSYQLNKISILSPHGIALLGKRKGDIVEVEMINGLCRIEILDIQHSYLQRK